MEDEGRLRLSTITLQDMQYVGIHTQQMRNNLRSILLLCLFPTIILGLVWVFFYIVYGQDVTTATYGAAQVLPWVCIIVGAWFFIAYMTNTSMVRSATGARSLMRRENPRVYNIVENLTMACGMPMPKVNVIDTPELNAFASGVDDASYTVTVTTGICERLNDEELAGVIGHELTHIRNRDTRLLIVSIVFVGIMSTIMSLAFRLMQNTFYFGGGRRSRDEKSGVSVVAMLAIAAVLAALGYLFTLLTRFAISRKREFMADAGGAELCGNPLALASALRKISSNPLPAPEGRDDVAQLYIIHSSLSGKGVGNFLSSMFATHPSTEERIKYLEQF